jgi:beta-lactamase class A
MPLRSWRLQVIGAALAVAAAIISAQSFASAREAASAYLIQPGDSLLGIAQTTGIAMDRLVSLNSIANPDFIVAGQTLSLDGTAQPATVHGPVQSTPDPLAGPLYTVKTGDTLWDISLATGVSVDSVVQLNNLTNVDQLTIGEVLRLPATAVTQRSAAAKPKPTATPAAQAKPTAAPTPPAKPAAPASGSLQQRLAAEVLRVGGPNVHVGAAAYNLSTGERISLHADDAFPSASVMKLPILVELERQTTAGTLPWTESLRAEASAMIAISDNGAANQIAEAIHPQSVNDTMAKLGLGGTHFVNLFTDTRGPSNPGQNQTTPSNMARLLELIATDQVAFLNPQASGDIKNLLARNVDRSKLVRLLPADAKVAHKSGWYDGVANDVGIVTVDRVPTRWTIAVFTENLPDAETGNQIVAAVSKLVYDAWGQ